MKQFLTLCLLPMALIVTHISYTLGQETQFADSLFDEGMVMMEHHQFDRAIPLFQSSYASDSSKTMTLRHLAYCYFQSGRYAEAIDHYRQLLESNPEEVKGRYQLATIYTKQKEYAAAMTEFRQLIALDPSNSYYHKKLALVALWSGAIQEGIDHYNQALALNPNDLTVVVDLCKLYRKIEAYDLADSLADRGLALQPAHLELQKNKALLAYQRRDYPAVILHVERLFELGNDSTTMLLQLLGMSYYRTEEFEAAIPLLEQVMNSDPSKEGVHFYLGMSYRETGDLTQSSAYLEQAIDQGISDHISTYYQQLGITYEAQGDFGASIRAYQAAYRSSNEKILLYHLARSYDAYYQDKSTAIQYYQRYLAMNDSDNLDYMDYSKQRMSELQREAHFRLDTLD